MSKPTLSALAAIVDAYNTLLADSDLGRLTWRRQVKLVKEARTELDRLRSTEAQPKKPRVIIEISGGVCQAVHSSVEISYDVLDHDNLEACDPVADPSTKEEFDGLKALEREIETLPFGY